MFHVEHSVLPNSSEIYVCTPLLILLEARELRGLGIATPAGLGANEIVDVSGSRAEVSTFAKSANEGHP